jgi:hypothetical protein
MPGASPQAWSGARCDSGRVVPANSQHHGVRWRGEQVGPRGPYITSPPAPRKITDRGRPGAGKIRRPSWIKARQPELTGNLPDVSARRQDEWRGRIARTRWISTKATVATTSAAEEAKGDGRQVVRRAPTYQPRSRRRNR